MKYVWLIDDGANKKKHLSETFTCIFSFVYVLFQKHCHLELPALRSIANKDAQTDSGRKVVPLVQLQTFDQLLENMHCIEVISLGLICSCWYILCYRLTHPSSAFSFSVSFSGSKMFLSLVCMTLIMSLA